MEKIKGLITSEKGKDVLIVLIVILVGISSFLLGRLSKETPEGSLKIEYNGQEATALGSIDTNNSNISLNPSLSDKIGNQASGNYFASKKGKKYYSVGCSAGKTIKQENRIYFSSTTDAENAGYAPSTSCR